MLDSDLALIYGVETKALNRAVKRNRDRFPKDFVFQLTEKEWKTLKYQIGTATSSREHQRFNLSSPSAIFRASQRTTFDAKAGRLDPLWQEAMEDIKAGRTQPLDEVLGDQ